MARSPARRRALGPAHHAAPVIEQGVRLAGGMTDPRRGITPLRNAFDRGVSPAPCRRSWVGYEPSPWAGVVHDHTVAPQAAHPRSRTCRHDEAVLMDPAVIGPVVATQDRVAAVRGADTSAGLGVETIFRRRKPEVAHHRSELVRVGTEARPASFQSVGPILFHAGGRQNRTSRGRNPPRLPHYTHRTPCSTTPSSRPGRCATTSR